MKTGSPGDESRDGNGPSKPPPNEQPAILGGQLLAGYSSVRKRSEKEFSPPKMWCRLQEFPEEGFLRYRFALPVEWLADVRFEFHNCRAVYTLDVYEFPLKLFMPRQ